jgi:hypothetical protein
MGGKNSKNVIYEPYLSFDMYPTEFVRRTQLAENTMQRSVLSAPKPLKSANVLPKPRSIQPVFYPVQPVQHVRSRRKRHMQYSFIPQYHNGHYGVVQSVPKFSKPLVHPKKSKPKAFVR